MVYSPKCPISLLPQHNPWRRKSTLRRRWDAATRFKILQLIRHGLLFSAIEPRWILKFSRRWQSCSGCSSILANDFGLFQMKMVGICILEYLSMSVPVVGEKGKFIISMELIWVQFDCFCILFINFWIPRRAVVVGGGRLVGVAEWHE